MGVTSFKNYIKNRGNNTVASFSDEEEERRREQEAQRLALQESRMQESARANYEKYADEAAAQDGVKSYKDFVGSKYTSMQQKSVGDATDKDLANARESIDSTLDANQQKAVEDYISKYGYNARTNDSAMAAMEIAKNNNMTDKQFSDALNNYELLNSKKMGNSSTLTTDENVEYSRMKLMDLSEKEQEAVNSLIDYYRTKEDANDHISTAGGNPFLLALTPKKDFEKEEAAIKTLRDLGWSGEKIDEYKAAAERIVNDERTRSLNKNLEIDPNASTGEKVASAVGATMYDVALAPTRSIGTVAENVMGNHADGLGADTNSAAYRQRNTSREATQQVLENVIGNDHPIAQGVYQMGLATLESQAMMGAAAPLAGAGEVGAFAGKMLTLGNFGASAYSEGYVSAKERGASEEQAQSYGVMSGVAEAGAELLPLENLWNMAGGKVTKNYVKAWLKQVATEGVEEVATDLMNRFADFVVLGEDGKNEQTLRINNYIDQLKRENPQMSDEEIQTMARRRANRDFWKDAAIDFVGGAFGGAVNAGGAMYLGSRAANQQRQIVSDYYRNAAQNIEGDTNYDKARRQQAQKYADNPVRLMADTIDDSTLQGKAQKEEVLKYAEKYEKEGKLSTKDNFALNQIMEEAEETRTPQEKFNRYLREVSETPNEYRTAVTGITASEGRARMQEAIKNKDVAALSEAFDAMRNSSSAEARKDAEEALNEFSAMARANGMADQDLNGIRTSAQDAYTKGLRGVAKEELGYLNERNERAYNEGAKKRAEGRSVFLDSTESLKATTNTEGINLTGEFDESGNLKTSDGKTVSIDDVQGSKAVQTVYANASKQKTTNARNAYVAMVKDGMNVNTYDLAFNRFYTAGSTGVKYETAVKNGAGAMLEQALGKEYTQALYDVGKSDFNAEISKRNTENVNKAFNIKRGSGVFQDARTVKNSDMDSSVLDAMAKAAGINIRLINSTDDNVNAFFDPATSTITVTEDHAAAVFHELMEFSDFYAGDEYLKLRDAVVNVAADILGEDKYNNLIKGYREAYERVNEGETNFESSNEFVNDMIVGIMSTEEGQKKFADYLTKKLGASEAQTLGGKIKAFFKKMVKSLRNLIDNSSLTKSQRQIAEAKIDEIESIYDQIFKTLDTAIESYEAAELEEAGVEVHGDGEMRFSIATYEEAQAKGEKSGRDYLKVYLEKYSGLSKKDQKDIIDTLDWGFELAKEMAADEEYRSFSNWSQTKLELNDAGVPLLEVFKDDGRPIRSAVVNNGEYPLNIDFSQVCKKRIALNTVLNKLVSDADLNIAVLTESDIAGINNIIKEHEFEIACGLCFVDSKRYRVGSWADSFVNGEVNEETHKKEKMGWNDLVRSMLPKGASADYFNLASDHVTPVGALLHELSDKDVNFKTINKIIKPYLNEKKGIGQTIIDGKKANPTEEVRMAYLLKTDPSTRKLLDNNDIIASEGLDALRSKCQSVYQLVNAHGGTSKPKLSHGFTAYGNDILRSTSWKGKKNKFTKANAYAVGGVRVQSFSDYVANMFFDYMQMFADMSTRELPSHAYTKEATYVKLFGMTGQRINMSLIFKGANLTKEQSKRLAELLKKGRKEVLKDPEFGALCERAGLDENGNYIFEDESFDFEEAKRIQSDPRYKYCGTIGVGLSDMHIRKMLNDDDIKMVIPYHSSGVSQLIKNARNLGLYTDYTKVQNTRGANGEKLESGDGFDWYGLLKSEINPKGLDAKAVAKKYLEHCDKKGYIPKFDAFRDEPNYYKLLIDFRAYDNDGKFMPQGSVTMTFPEEAEFKQLVSESLTQQQETEDRMEKEMTGEQATLYDEVKKFLKKQGTLQEKKPTEKGYKAKFSLGGIHAANVDDASYRKAYALERAGKSAEEIYKETGWYRGADGKYRFEISNRESKVFVDGLAKLSDSEEYKRYVELNRKLNGTKPYEDTDEFGKDWKEYSDLYDRFKDIANKKEYRLDDVLKHDELFKYYPALTRIKVVFGDLDPGVRGSFNPETRTITISNDLRNGFTSQTTLRKVLLHEVQHAIQEIEGFARGSSDVEWRNRRLPKIISDEAQKAYDDALERLSEIEERVPKGYLDRYNEYMVQMGNYGGLAANENWYESAQKIAEELQKEDATLFDELEEAFWDADVLKPDGEELLPLDAYHATAGEIEAREVMDRLDMSEEERRAKMPNIKDEKGRVVFAERRYSLEADSEGRELSEGQQEYFKDSKIRDEEGRLKVMYHGTKTNFTVFNPVEFGGVNGIAEGYGIYLSDDSAVSEAYGNTMIKAYANIKHPANINGHTIKKKDLVKLIKATCQKEAAQFVADGDYDNIDDAIRDTWVSNYVNTYDGTMDQAYAETAQQILNLNSNDFNIVQEVMSGLAIRDYASAYDFYEILTRELGIDGFVTEWSDAEGNDTAEVVLAFNSNQVKNIDNENPTEDPDIRYSLSAEGLEYSSSKDSNGNKLTNAQEFYFRNSEVRDADGKLKVMYHGTAKGGFTVFDPEMVDDKLSFFFTDNRDVAESYIKDNADSAKVYEVYLNAENPLKVDGKRHIEGKANSVSLVHSKGSDQIAFEYYTDLGLFHDRVDIDDLQSYISRVFGDDAAEVMKSADTVLGNLGAHWARSQAIDVSVNNDFASNWSSIRFNGQIMSTRMLAQYAKDNGYDSLIIDNVVDAGGYDPKGNVASSIAVMFESDQIKNIDNKAPTNNADIRRSIEIDEFWNSEEFLGEAFVEAGSILEDGMEALKGQEVDSKRINKIATDLRKEYGSNINVKTFADMMEKAFAYMQTNDHVNYNDMMRIMEEIARPVIEEATTTVGEDEYRAFVNELKGFKIKLNAKQMAEVKSAVGSYADFKRAMYPLTFSNNGVSLDSIWGEIVERTGYLLDAGTTEADQPLALYDVLSSLRPSPVNNFGGDIDEVSRDLAMRIVEEYLGAEEEATIKEAVNNEKGKRKEYDKKVRDRYNRNLKNAKDKIKSNNQTYRQQLRERLAKAKADMQAKRQQYQSEVKGRYDERLSDAKAKMREELKQGKYDNRVRLMEMRQDNLERIAALKAKNKERAMNARETREARALKNKISKRAKALSTWIMNPTENHHVPMDMVEPVTDFLTALDFVEPDVKVNKNGDYYVRVFNHSFTDGNGKRQVVFDTITGKSRDEVIRRYYMALGAGLGSNSTRTWIDKMEALENVFAKVKSNDNFEHSDMSEFVGKLDASLADALEDVMKRNKRMLTVNNLRSADLKVVDNVLRNISHAITQGNEAFAQNEEINNMAEDTLATAQDINSNKPESKLLKKMAQTLKLDMATPETYFSLLGDGGKKIYKALRKGFNQKVADVRKAQVFMETIMKPLGKKELAKWTGLKADLHTFTVSDGEISLTTAQIMSLYELNKRDQAVLHFKGGVEADVVTKKEGARTRVYNSDTTPVHLTDGEIQKIIDTLTPQQMILADQMQQYMAVECAADGNETSRKMYGFEKFTDPNYFPISTDKSYISANNSNTTHDSLNGIERSGFTKQLMQNASNPIIIKDIFDVFTDHVADMATYHGFAPAIKDALRWFNYKTVDQIDEDTGRWNSVQKAIKRISGEGGSQYFVKLLKDINGSEKSQYIGNFTDSLISNYKAAAVGANLRVIIQQPTAYFRAMNLINPKYLTEAVVSPAEAHRIGNKMRAESEIAWWKSQGYFETSIGKSMREIITGQSTFAEDLRNKSMALAGWADDITWGVLYTAVTKEQQAKARGQNLTEEELNQRIKDRFDEVVDETQVVDSTLHRSQYMRSKDTLNKLQTAFMAEPTKSYNMMLKAIMQDAREKKGFKRTAKAAFVFALTNVMTSAAAAVIDAFRKDDDETNWLEVYINAFRDNIIDNVNPLNLIPVLKDFANAAVNVVTSVVTGESNFQSNSNRMDIDAVNTLIDAGAESYKYFITGDSNKTPYGMFMTLARPVSQLTGLPVYNLSRDLSALYNSFMPDLKKSVSSNKYSSVYDAIKSDKSADDIQEVVDGVLNEGGTVYDLQSGITSRYKSDYQDLYNAGDEESLEKAAALAEKATKGFIAIGMTEEEAEAVIQEWQDPTYGYSALDDAIEMGEGIEEAVKYLQEAKDDDKIIEHIVDHYGSTVRYNRANGIESDIESNVDKALKAVDKSTNFNKASKAIEEKEAEAAAKKQLQEEKNELKEKTYSIIDSGNGDYQKAVNDWAAKLMGDDTSVESQKDAASTIKTSMTKDYTKPLIVAYKNGDYTAQQLLMRVATIKAYIDGQVGTKIAKKYGGNYYQYELDQIIKLMDEYDENPWEDED